MGLYLDIARSVQSKSDTPQIAKTDCEISEISEISPGDVAEATREYISERAAIQEFDGGLSRPEAERQAQAACKVYEYRIMDSPLRWLIMIAPGCDLTEAARSLRLTFAERFIEVRPYTPRIKP